MPTPRLPKPAGRQTQGSRTVWSSLIAVIADFDLQAVVAFCLIGFLLNLNFILRFPDIEVLIEQHNKY
jgi:hypothetical protein